MNMYRHNMLNLIVWATVACFCTSAFAETLSSDSYYTWGISGADLDIPDGSIITEAVLTIQGITNWDNNLHMHIVDNPPLDFISNVDNDSGDFFQDFGGLLSGYSYALVDGDLVIAFSQINDENSWVWDIFDDPFNFQTDFTVVSYSSSLLELVDYAGNSTPFGIGFDPDGNSYNFQAMTLDLTVESYEGQSEQSLLTFTMLGTGYSGLAAYWPMDDSSADTIVLDASANGNTGTAHQNTFDVSVSGIIDGALSFDGDSDYIQISDSPALSPSDEVTIAGWFWFDAADENVGLVWKHSYNYALCTVQDTIRFSVWNAPSQESRASFSTSLLSSGWNFIAAVFDGTNSTLYLNGSQAGSIGAAITGGIRDRNGDLYIGRRADGVGDEYFDGKIDNLSIYGAALSADDIEALFDEVGGDLVGHWPMNDSSADTIVLDASANGNTGAAHQNTFDVSVSGIIDGALSFDGDGDYIQISDSTALSPTEQVTVSGWFWFDAADENVGLVWKDSYNFALCTVKNTVRFSVWNASPEESRASFSTSLLSSGWNFIAAVFDGTNSTLYLNGSQAGSIGASITGGIRDRNGDLYIGRRADGVGDEYFDGKIDDVKIHDQALTPEEITSLYNLVP